MVMECGSFPVTSEGGGNLHGWSWGRTFKPKRQRDRRIARVSEFNSQFLVTQRQVLFRQFLARIFDPLQFSFVPVVNDMIRGVGFQDQAIGTLDPVLP